MTIVRSYLPQILLKHQINKNFQSENENFVKFLVIRYEYNKLVAQIIIEEKGETKKILKTYFSVPMETEKFFFHSNITKKENSSDIPVNFEFSMSKIDTCVRIINFNTSSICYNNDGTIVMHTYTNCNSSNPRVLEHKVIKPTNSVQVVN